MTKCHVCSRRIHLFNKKHSIVEKGMSFCSVDCLRMHTAKENYIAVAHATGIKVFEQCMEALNKR